MRPPHWMADRHRAAARRLAADCSKELSLFPQQAENRRPAAARRLEKARRSAEGPRQAGVRRSAEAQSSEARSSEARNSEAPR